MTLVTLAVVYAYFTKPRPPQTSACDPAIGSKKSWITGWAGFPFWRSLLLVFSAVPIAILTNALRVSGTGVLAHYYGTRVADGFFHSFSGWVIYIVAALMLFGTGWLIDRLRGTFSRLFRVGLLPDQVGGSPPLKKLQLSE